MKNPEENIGYWSRPDWTRESPKRFWDPGRKLLKAIRDYQRHEKKTLYCLAARGLCVLRHRFWSAVCSSEISLNTKIEGGLLLPHPYGIVIHPDAEIGPNCLIFQNVTLAGKVKLKYHVDVGAGAFLRGPISISENVTIGANAVVLNDVKANSVCVGVPASTKSKSECSET